VLRAVRRDLVSAYSQQYRVLHAESGPAALRLLEALRDRREEVALLIADQRMPEMTGVEFLGAALSSFPAARRVLLTAYADTNVAIDAINHVRLHHYLVKPWEPPEDRLYPVLNELLDDWQASREPSWGGIEVHGPRFAPATHRIRDFLTRHQQPFRFVEAEEAPGVSDAHQDAAGTLPLVVLPDGTRLARPTLARLAVALGLPSTPSRPFYDVAIIGAGPAGLATAVYAASEGLSALLVDAEVPGGQAGTTSKIDNYPGFPSGISGAELARRAVMQARRFGTEILSPVEATALVRAGRALEVSLSDGQEIGATTVVLATGLRYRRLDAANADRFEGAGVYYGATVAESASCAGHRVLIVGGGNSAGQAALHFARKGAHVSMLVRGESLEASMSQYLIDEIRQAADIQVRLGTRLTSCAGSERLEQVALADSAGGVATEDAEYVFSFIGARPRTGWLDQTVVRDADGFIVTGSDLGEPRAIGGWDLPRAPFLLESSMPGVFAAGDVRSGSVKRLTSGVGDGTIAAALLHRYMAEG
jgi:thioredoxin reductase (NADPH)